MNSSHRFRRIVGLGISLALPLTFGIALLHCTEPPPPTGGGNTVYDLLSPPIGNGDGMTTTADMTTIPPDMSVVCQAGQRLDGNSCVCDTASCLCGACSGNQCVPRTLASGQMTPRSIVIDNGDVYFANAGGASVQKVKTDGTGLATVDNTVASPLGLAIDASNIYLSAPMGGTVYRYSRSEMRLYTMATGINVPRVLAIDATAVYALSITNNSVSKVLIANNMTSTLASGLSSPYGMAVDTTGVYFTTGDGKVNRVGLDGTNLTSLATGQTDPRGIALDGTTIYWANHNSGAVYALDKSGGTLRRLGKTTFLESLALDNNNVYATSANGQVVRFSKSLIDQTPIVVASGQGNPFGIALDASCVYWTNDGTGTVMKGDK